MIKNKTRQVPWRVLWTMNTSVFHSTQKPADERTESNAFLVNLTAHLKFVFISTHWIFSIFVRTHVVPNTTSLFMPPKRHVRQWLRYRRSVRSNLEHFHFSSCGLFKYALIVYAPKWPTSPFFNSIRIHVRPSSVDKELEKFQKKKL